MCVRAIQNRSNGIAGLTFVGACLVCIASGFHDWAWVEASKGSNSCEYDIGLWDMDMESESCDDDDTTYVFSTDHAGGGAGFANQLMTVIGSVVFFVGGIYFLGVAVGKVTKVKRTAMRLGIVGTIVAAVKLIAWIFW